MRSQLSEIVENGRIRSGEFRSLTWDGPNGMFLVMGPNGRKLRIIASNGEGWEHVSVSLDNRCPNWPEMCFVKDLFWEDDECVVQYHPPKSQYVNFHPRTLHLWRSKDQSYPMPPLALI